jgi:hypothetical protein
MIHTTRPVSYVNRRKYPPSRMLVHKNNAKSRSLVAQIAHLSRKQAECETDNSTNNKSPRRKLESGGGYCADLTNISNSFGFNHII